MRCDWAHSSDLMKHYHDTEWGVPCYDDTKLFQHLMLETAQAGLSWATVLNKRENYRKALDGFDPKKIAKYDEKKIAELMQNAGLIRNEKKMRAFVNNAQAFLEIQKEFGTFSDWMWSFTDNKVIDNKPKKLEDLPAQTEISKHFCKELKKRGFTFVGPVTSYAHMQAVGMVNDHIMSCVCRK